MFQSMAKTLAITLTLSSSLAFGHGSIADQAAHAVEAAAHLFESTQPANVRNQFGMVAARWIAHETFQVTISLKSGTQFNYKCVENEDVEPVIWECQAL